MTNEMFNAVCKWADKNAAGWVLDLLQDTRPAAVRGPLRDKRCCDVMAEQLAKQLGLLQ